MKINIIVLLMLFAFGTAAQEKVRKSYHGGVFTPKGDFKALIVPVIFKDQPLTNPAFKNKENPLQGWTVGNQQNLPDQVDPISGDCPSWLYNRPEHFEQFKDSSFFNDSKMFYHISNGSFRFMAEVFKDSSGNPIALEIDPEGGRDWSHMNKKAMEAMKAMNPDFDFSPFDQRKNNPQYSFDNSMNPEPDKTVDYIVFIYRYSPNWAQHPAPGMQKWPGSGGGFASPSGVMLETYNGYRFAQGFTMMWGSGVFFHELAHTLYNLPHLWGTNGTVGEYFYRPSVGWGATSSAGLFQIPSAWETWFLGYNELLADIKGPKDLENGDIFELKDYCTYGDAIRIELPFSGGQQLWLEFHSTDQPFDRHIWSGTNIGNDKIAMPAPGVYAYLEKVADRHDNIPSVLSPVCNAIKPLNAAGNFDYEYIDENPAQNAWGNKLYRFRKLRANPLSGTNPFYYFRDDFNKDGIIGLDKNYNGARNEGEPIMCEEILPDSFANLYQCFGVYDSQWQNVRAPAFQSGDYLGLGSNPTLCAFAKYNDKTAQMDPVYLSGLRIDFLKGSKNGQFVKISFGETVLNNNIRWTGNFILPNISADANPDLIIAPGKALLLDKSATVNRHTKTASGDFINPTRFTVKSDAMILLQKRSRMLIEKGTVVEFEPGAGLKMEKGARLIVKKGAQLILNGNTGILHKKARILQN